jgi:hypothetical protein
MDYHLLRLDRLLLIGRLYGRQPPLRPAQRPWTLFRYQHQPPTTQLQSDSPRAHVI